MNPGELARTLVTERLCVRPFTEDDISPGYIGWLNDPGVVRFSELRHTTHDADSCRQYLKSFIGSPHYYWAICLASTPVLHVGNITAHVDLPNGRADVGILLGNKSVWGKGYGLEAWSAVCTYLLGLSHIRQVTAGAMASNLAMQKIAERAGMVRDAVRPAYFLLEGRPEDAVYWRRDA